MKIFRYVFLGDWDWVGSFPGFHFLTTRNLHIAINIEVKECSCRRLGSTVLERTAAELLVISYYQCFANSLLWSACFCDQRTAERLNKNHRIVSRVVLIQDYTFLKVCWQCSENGQFLHPKDTLFQEKVRTVKTLNDRNNILFQNNNAPCQADPSGQISILGCLISLVGSIFGGYKKTGGNQAQSIQKDIQHVSCLTDFQQRNTCLPFAPMGNTKYL